MPQPTGERGGGPRRGPGEQVPLPGGVGGRGLPADRQPLQQADAARDGAPEAAGRPPALQWIQVHGQAHHQRLWQEEEVRMNRPSIYAAKRASEPSRRTNSKQWEKTSVLSLTHTRSVVIQVTFWPSTPFSHDCSALWIMREL